MAMPAAFEIFTPAYDYVDGRLEALLAERLGAVLAESAPAIRAALVLYVLLHGFSILRGAIAEPVMEFMVRSLKLAVIAALAGAPAYQDYVTEPLFHILPQTVARAISGGTAPDIGAAFDQFYARAAYLAEDLNEAASLTHPGPWLVAALVYGSAALTAAIGFGIVLMAKVALALLIALGPFFVACALFEATRRYFFGWLGQAVNYIILFGLILAVLQLVFGVVADQWPQIEGGDPVAGGLTFVALCLLAALFFFQTPAIAAGIAGGAHAGLSDFAAATGLGRLPAASAPHVGNLGRNR